MAIHYLVLEMLSAELREAVVAAQARLADDTIMARINMEFVEIEVGGTIVETSLTEAQAIDVLENLA